MNADPTKDLPREILEKYEILEKIGEGGMGRVYKVRHRVLQRFDVCKCIHSRIFLNEDHKKKFIKEAQISSQLKKHKNIVTVYGAGAEDGDAPYILFEFVKGVPLDRKIKEAQRLPVKEALWYAKEICEGLAYAHSMGIVHRDIKSENIILTDQIVDGFAIPKIADFGIAKGKGEAPKAKKQDWAIHGTPSYMSPEQAAGEEATERSDLYSVGIIMYEMLTGAVPFKGSSLHQVIMQHINEVPKPVCEVVPEIPVQVAELVQRAVEKKPEDRYESAEDFAGKLEKALSLIERWQKNLASGHSGKLGTSGARGRSATSSFSSFPRAASTSGVTSGRFAASGAGAQPAGAAQAPDASGATVGGPLDLRGIALDLWGRYRLQIAVGGSALAVLMVFLLARLVFSGSGVRSTLAWAPRDLRVYQGVKNVVVCWKSEAPYASVVECGPDEKNAAQERGAASDESDHSVKLANLKPGTKYHYRIVYPGGEKSLPYNFVKMEADHRFWMSAAQDRGVRFEGDTTVAAKAVLFYTKGGKEQKISSQEGDVFETSHSFRADDMNPDADRVQRIQLTFPTGEQIDIPGDKVKPR
jgi:serine/threonine protein kinase